MLKVATVGVMDDGGKGGGVKEVGGKGVALVEGTSLEVERGGAILQDDGGAGDGVV